MDRITIYKRELDKVKTQIEKLKKTSLVLIEKIKKS
jgi:hypothetical protein